MRITTRLKIISTITIVALVVLVPVLIWSFIEFRNVKNDYVIADAITYKYLVIIVSSLAGTLALAITLTSIYLGRLIRKRLALLHAGAKIVADGNLDFRIKCSGADEFSDLAMSINAMTDRLQSFMRQLEAEGRIRNQAEITLRDNEAFVSAVLDSIPNEIAVLDSHGVIKAVNNSWSNFAMENGIEPGRPAPHTEVGNNYLELCRTDTESPSDGVMSAYDGIRAVLDGRLPAFSLEYPCHSPNRQRWFSMTVSPLEFRWHGVVVAHIDITERKAMEDQVRQLAFYDPLTKLANRRLLNDRLSQAMSASIRSGCYGALMFLDLDNFKPLNDTYGHDVGDLLLVEAANRLKGCVREMDTVARFGGDEFVLMLSELSVDKAESTSQAKVVAEKIRSTLSEPYRLIVKHEEGADATVEHHCTASIGVTLFINHEASQDDIIKRADAAMYQAKDEGRNLVRFSG